MSGFNHPMNMHSVPILISAYGSLMTKLPWDNKYAGDW